MALTAAAVLARIALADTAASAPETTALVVGHDGTFRAGVLHGRVPGASTRRRCHRRATLARGSASPPQPLKRTASKRKPRGSSRTR